VHRHQPRPRQRVRQLFVLTNAYNTEGIDYARSKTRRSGRTPPGGGGGTAARLRRGAGQDRRCRSVPFGPARSACRRRLAVLRRHRRARGSRLGRRGRRRRRRPGRGRPGDRDAALELRQLPGLCRGSRERLQGERQPHHVPNHSRSRTGWGDGRVHARQGTLPGEAGRPGPSHRCSAGRRGAHADARHQLGSASPHARGRRWW
jgi:hypothetical protein